MNYPPNDRPDEAEADENRLDLDKVDEIEAALDTDAESDSDEDAEFIVSETKPAKSGIGLGTAIILSTLAALAGGMLGALAPQFLGAEDRSASENLSAQYSESLTRLERDQQDLESTLSQLETNLSALQSELGSIEQLELSLGQLKTQAPPIEASRFDDIQNRLDIMDELLQNSELPGANPSALADRLSNISMRLDAFDQSLAEVKDAALTAQAEARAAASQLREKAAQMTAEPVIISYETGEAAAAQAIEPSVSSEQLEALIRTFPQQALLNVRAAQSQSQAQSGGLLGRIFNRHVQIRDIDAPDLDAVIEQARSDLEGGDISAAIKALEGLPSAYEPASQNWILQARRAL